MVARQGNDILVVTDLDKVLYDDAVDRAAPHSQAGVSTSGKNRPCEFMTAGKHPATLTDTIFSLFSLSHRDLARRCSQCNGITEKQRYTCELKIVTGLPWESFQFLIFCVVVSRSSLPSARFLIMRSWYRFTTLLCISCEQFL